MVSVALLATTWLASSAAAQGVGEHRVMFARGDGGTYQLTGPDGNVAASGTYDRDGFIEVGWWRGPGTYTFARDYVGMRAETSVTLDGTEHDLALETDMYFHLAPVVWRETPAVTAIWVDDGHLALRNDTGRDLTVGTTSGRVFWEHQPAERGLSPSERARRTYHPLRLCGTGFATRVVPAHDTVTVAVDMLDRLLPGDYHGAIRLTAGDEHGGVVATFDVTVVADASPAGGHLTHR